MHDDGEMAEVDRSRRDAVPRVCSRHEARNPPLRMRARRGLCSFSRVAENRRAVAKDLPEQ